jgi:hypothetical protein
MFGFRFPRFLERLSLHMVATGLVVLVLVLLAGISATSSPAMARAFPEVLPLPDGFAPEGIAIGRGTTFYVGSLVDGAIYAGDLRTGEGAILVPGDPDRVAVGLDVDERSNYLFVSGHMTGQAYVYDAGSGALLATYQLADPADGDTFINDVIVTRDAAYFTDSFRPYIYRVPLGPAGTLPDAGAVEAIELTGEFQFQAGGFNSNGIAATADGEWLIVVNSTFGTLYRVDPATGYADEIDLGGDTVERGDGILLHGSTLYVVQNFFNQIAVIELEPDLLSGTIVDVLDTGDAPFRIPTTVDRFGGALYAVNARFDTPVAPDVEYEVVRVVP